MHYCTAWLRTLGCELLQRATTRKLRQQTENESSERGTTPEAGAYNGDGSQSTQTSAKHCKTRSPTSMAYRKKHDSELHKSEALMESRGSYANERRCCSSSSSSSRSSATPGVATDDGFGSSTCSHQSEQATRDASDALYMARRTAAMARHTQSIKISYPSKQNKSAATT